VHWLSPVSARRKACSSSRLLLLRPRPFGTEPSALTEVAVEVSVPQDLLEKILSSTTPEAVLVGGQSLAFWVSRYSIDLPPQFQVGAISDDADFLGSKADIQAIACGTHGKAEYASGKLITALVGQVTIPLSPAEYVNVDVLYKVIGPAADDVRKRASEVSIGKANFLVMNPMDVFVSRVCNLSRLREKQNPQGIEQTKLGIAVAREYIEEVAAIEPDGQDHAIKLIEHVYKLAKSGDGHRVTRDFGIDFRGAIPKYAIKVEKFLEIRYPQILRELTPPPAVNH